MKTLTLIRHAKSNWDNPALDDVDRPLNPRGKRDAPVMGKRLADRKLDLELIVSSPAKRALTTARVIAKALAYDKEKIRTDPSVYQAEVEDLLRVIRGLPAEVDRAALVGHNPGFTDLANALTGGHIENVPTCGMVHLELMADTWVPADRGAAVLVFFDFPKKTGGWTTGTA